MTGERRSPVGGPRAGDRGEDVVKVTLRFDTPLSKDDLRERCTAIAEHLEDGEGETDE
ncbi:hypothetical protein ACLI4Z_19230 (plasmid) [Natrialbaceae archaeon A-arb3/5]